jgi:hypothetical protein
MWVDIQTFSGLNMPIGNHYFFPGTEPEVIINYFHFLGSKSNTHTSRVIVFGDLNTTG